MRLERFGVHGEFCEYGRYFNMLKCQRQDCVKEGIKSAEKRKILIFGEQVGSSG